jgi:predicted dehydrogenase
MVMDDEPISVGVIGLGHFGRFHAQKWAKTQGAKLTALVDQDQTRAQSLAQELGGDIQVLQKISDLAGRVQAVSIAVPTLYHHAVAREVMAMGIHVLIEKPIAADLVQADELIADAATAGIIFQVGHQERFFVNRLNLTSQVANPTRLSTIRCGVPSGRMMDCSVVLDLMIHDIDLCLSLMGRSPVKVEAVGYHKGSALIERAEVDLTFENGATARLVADRMADARQRAMVVEDDQISIVIDFLTRTAIHSANGPIVPMPVDPMLEADTLLAETTAFLQAVKGRAPIVVDGAAGRRALEVALAIEAAMVARD